MERMIGCVTTMNVLHFLGSEERLGGGGQICRFRLKFLLLSCLKRLSADELPTFRPEVAATYVKKS
jgi:hypothetical protein